MLEQRRRQGQRVWQLHHSAQSLEDAQIQAEIHSERWLLLLLVLLEQVQEPCVGVRASVSVLCAVAVVVATVLVLLLSLLWLQEQTQRQEQRQVQTQEQKQTVKAQQQQPQQAALRFARQMVSVFVPYFS